MPPATEPATETRAPERADRLTGVRFDPETRDHVAYLDGNPVAWDQSHEGAVRKLAAQVRRAR